MELTIRTARKDAVSLITVQGDIDLSTSTRLRAEILKEVAGSSQRVALDLSGVRYMDSSGVATLVEGLRSARDHDTSFRLVAPSTKVMKVLQMTRLDTVFEVGSEP